MFLLPWWLKGILLAIAWVVVVQAVVTGVESLVKRRAHNAKALQGSGHTEDNSIGDGA